jgi:diguanylate cyclase (GGDEF)-like protein
MPEATDKQVTLRLLMIEDNPDDEALVLRAIRKGGFTVDYIRVDKPDDLQAALRHNDWDIVLSDYQMPAFNGLAALKIVKKLNNDLPFIIVSGTIGEELAVEAMRSGAQDYLMKDNLTRLVPAIRRELNDADERRALREAQQALRHQAYHDILTGLPNRWLLRDRMEQAMKYARQKETGMAVMFLDLDRFKNLNDTLGHLAGDYLLRAVAERLSLILNERDTLARLGGDDFVVLMVDMPGAEQAGAAADLLLKAMQEPFELDDKKMYVGASIGVALFPDNGDEFDLLIKNAESAMYYAKDQGRNNYQFFAKDIREATANRFTIESELRGAIRSSELCLHYQPQFTLPDGRITGLEALVRWVHPQHGVMPPDKFIPVAEESGLIIPLGEWVLRQAALDSVKMRNAGCVLSRLAINLSAQQLFHQGTLDMLQDLVGRGDLGADSLEIEITESGIMQNPELAVTNLSAIRDMGIGIAIDDFGTGYSSLAYLKRFPINILKIDRSFIRDITLDQDDTTIVKTILAMSEALNMRAIAEGVETQEQKDILAELGCAEGQGYLFARPMPCEDLISFFRSRECA